MPVRVGRARAVSSVHLSAHPLPTIDPLAITGLVLAGGQGSRMDGSDKGLQPFRGEPLVAHVLRRLAPQVGSLLIGANRNLERYRSFGHPVVADEVPGYAGPLAGLHAGLMHCRTDYLVAVPCDAPFVAGGLVAALAGAFEDALCDIAVASTTGRRHPVFCLMRRSVVDDLGDYLDRGGRGAGTWIERLHGRAVSFDDERAFVNLNTVADLDDAASIDLDEA